MYGFISTSENTSEDGSHTLSLTFKNIGDCGGVVNVSLLNGFKLEIN